MPNLVPDRPGTGPNYWCTWATQGYAPPEGAGRRDIDLGPEGVASARDNLDAHVVFGPQGWARHPEIAACRSDCLLLLDDGWDVTYCLSPRADRPRFGSLLPDSERWGTLGDTDSDLLPALVERTRQLGWAGLGIWVAAHPVAQQPGAQLAWTPEQLAGYYRERARACAVAELRYWKVDWGDYGRDMDYRALLTAIGDEYGITVEHASNSWAVNDWTGTGRYADMYYDEHSDHPKLQVADCRALLATGHVLRAYDLLGQLATVTMLDRIGTLLCEAPPDSPCLLNAEDEVYLAAATGCSMGIMRHPSWSCASGHDPRSVRRSCTEALRALRWQRLAPPWPAGRGELALSDELFEDSWNFTADDTWWDQVVGHEVRQRAPARLARGGRLPQVSGDDLPFVACSRHPDGPVAIASLWRAHERSLRLPRARIELDIDDPLAPIGVFGDYESLVLRWNRPTPITRIWAQDLATETAVDVTDRVRLTTGSLLVPGELIREIGQAANSPDDRSDPGLVLRLS